MQVTAPPSDAYVDARQTRRIRHTEYLRALIVGIGAVLTIVFFVI
jgi:uncharacterized protein